MACGNDAEVLVKALKEVRRDREGPGADFVWAQFRELSVFYEARADEQRRGGRPRPGGAGGCGSRLAHISAAC